MRKTVISHLNCSRVKIFTANSGDILVRARVKLTFVLLFEDLSDLKII